MTDLDRIKALSPGQAVMLAAGYCPECEQKVRGWSTPVGSFAPEAWAALRDQGVDPASGHKESCSWKGLKP